MIRFSASLVVGAVGLLLAGVITSKLALVYLAIAVSAVALIALAIGVIVKREEFFGEAALAAESQEHGAREPAALREELGASRWASAPGVRETQQAQRGAWREPVPAAQGAGGQSVGGQGVGGQNVGGQNVGGPGAGARRPPPRGPLPGGGSRHPLPVTPRNGRTRGVA